MLTLTTQRVVFGPHKCTHLRTLLSYRCQLTCEARWLRYFQRLLYSLVIVESAKTIAHPHLFAQVLSEKKRKFLKFNILTISPTPSPPTSKDTLFKATVTGNPVHSRISFPSKTHATSINL